MDENNLANVLRWVVGIDAESAKTDVVRLRAKHPGATERFLSERLFGPTRWKATGIGVLTGLPANPWVMLPAAIADLASVLRLEAETVARVALLFDPAFFDEPGAEWELLVPIFGLEATSQFLRELGVLGSMGVTRQVIRKYLSKEALHSFQKIMLKYFGIKVTQKSVISKTLPVVGALIGGGWNFGELTILRNRTIAYFESQAKSTDDGTEVPVVA